MKLFEIKKFSFDAINPVVLSENSDNIKLSENSSGFDVSIEVEINHSEIVSSLSKKTNVIIDSNLVKFTSRCANNEIVMSVYDYVERNHKNDIIIKNLEKIIDTLNLWILE